MKYKVENRLLEPNRLDSFLQKKVLNNCLKVNKINFVSKEIIIDVKSIEN